MSIFDAVLARVAGESIDDFFSVNNYTDLKNLFEELWVVRKQKKEIVKEICGELFQRISEISDDKERRTLINAKRSLFNKEKLSNEEWGNIKNSILPDTCELYDTCELINSLEADINTQIKVQFGKLLSFDIEQLKTIGAGNVLRNGLLLSSLELYNYPLQDVAFNAKTEKYFLSYYKYASRVIAKTSPFSTFTNLAIGTIGETDKLVRIFDNNIKIISSIRYNNFILIHIYNTIMNRSVKNRDLFISLNNTIKIEEENILFFTNINNVDVYQRISYTDSIGYILETLKDSSFTLSALVDHLNDLNPDLGKDKISEYILQLISTGMIVFTLPFSPFDNDFDEKIIYFLEDASYSIHISLPPKFRSLILFKNEFISGTDRKEVLTKIEKSIDEILLILKDNISAISSKIKFNDNKDKLFNGILFQQTYNINKFDIRNLFYEDTVSTINFMVEEKRICRITNSIKKFISAFEPVSSFNIEKQAITNFFLDTYKHDEKVPLLDLYKDYYSYLKYNVNEIDTIQKKYVDIYNKASTEKSELIQIIKEYMTKIEEQDIEDIILPDSFLDDLINNNHNYNEIKQEKSRAAFIQFIDSHKYSDDNLVVVNLLTAGYGKYISRFLNLFDEKITTSLKNWNNKNSKVKMVENVDSSNFNGNIHPPIFNYELKWPGNYARLKPDNQIDIINLRVTYNDTTKNLDTFDSNGDKINIIDLGFQTPRGRSKLFLFLSYIGGIETLSLHHILSFFANTKKRNIQTSNLKKEVTFMPRIVIPGGILMRRKKWLFHVFDFQKAVKIMDALEFSLFLLQLKKETNIPDEIFFRNELDNSHSSRNIEYKPQYINLLSPISILLLHSLILKSKTEFFSFEEMYPSSSNMLSINNKKTVTEFLLQWY